MAKVTVKREAKQAKREKTTAKKAEAKAKIEAKAETEVKAETKVQDEPVKTEAKTGGTKTSSIQVTYQFGGREITEKTLITAVKEIWMEKGNKIKDIQSLNIYMKPEEMAAYYVINDTETGKIEL